MTAGGMNDAGAKPSAVAAALERIAAALERSNDIRMLELDTAAAGQAPAPPCERCLNKRWLAPQVPCTLCNADERLPAGAG